MVWCSRRPVAGLAIAVCICSAAVAWAQQPDHPLLLPKNDVTVVYRFDRIGLHDYHKWQVIYSDVGQRVRHDYFRWFEATRPFVTVIYDGPANRFITIHYES